MATSATVIFKNRIDRILKNKKFNIMVKFNDEEKIKEKIKEGENKRENKEKIKQNLELSLNKKKLIKKSKLT